ncbi:o-succinylbenzoate synthase [Kribbella sandramycini]|uniref:o-succinylbenzoate synthase n=1 Tax=Kribbella sandramycini TaxID=60450 RepID=A0A7Y4KW90_9ACTN|nr:o-succinylbenzoate synthase [Kribbella sandramycini]MBB6567655.1 O-succinylbenzoate synthase [Kribbella sandramycini]NOL39744.1 o-succinylbenzoate synthase [Kribbella sandramycini]
MTGLIETIEVRTVRLPLRSPFRTSNGVSTEREIVLVRLAGGGVEGWGECVAEQEPTYSPEYSRGAADVLRSFLLPRLVAADVQSAADVAPALYGIVGHPMAKAALELAVLDLELRQREISLARYFGAARTRIPAGVSVGIQPSVPALLDVVSGFLDEGYQRIKLKIQPGWDVEPVRAVRQRFGTELPLQVDANSAYDLADAAHLRRLDEFGLLLIEQPLHHDDLFQHARLAELITTPVCLDESIVSARAAAAAISLGAARIINIKPGRVGGYLEARRIHDLAQAHGVAVWCGGMLESGIGRRANIALAALPGFTLPGDTSASNRFYDTDLTAPVTLESDGHVLVPTGPGIGAAPDPELLAKFTEDSWSYER